MHEQLREQCARSAVSAVESLKKYKMTVSSAESCTGGMISSFLTGVSGASAVFELGVCTYSAKSKCKALGVKRATVRKHGTVSYETACEMAANVRKKADADIGVSVTGVAGPDSCEGKSVGTVFIALADKYGASAERLQLDGLDREEVRLSACIKVLERIVKYCEERGS